MANILWHSCTPWAPSGYGMQTAIWIQELIKMGHGVSVSSYWGLQGAPTTWNGIPVLPGFGANYCSASLSQHYQVMRPDLVITLGDIWVLDSGLLKEMNVAHWLPCDCRPQSLADRACIDRSGAQLIAISRFGYDRFRSAGYDPVYVPHSVDPEVFKAAEDRDKVRKLLGLDGHFVIGVNAANNDAIRKALPEMMLAFAKFAGNHPDAILTLHTGIHQEGGQDLEAVAENLGIVDMVRVADQYRYHAGLFTPPDLAEWYQAIDVLCATTYAEGFGIPIMEAQACQTPVITTNASSMPELNPYGISVDGEPFWNGVHKGWWIRPSSRQIYEAFERSYEMRDDVNRKQLSEFALGYRTELVAEQYMKPAVNELLERVKIKG